MFVIKSFQKPLIIVQTQTCTFFFSGKTSIWIGLKAQQWVNGKPFINVFGFQTQLNNQDSAFPGDNEQDCTVVYFQSANVFQDESCNIRVKSNYLCEITMS